LQFLFLFQNLEDGLKSKYFLSRIKNNDSILSEDKSDIELNYPKEEEEMEEVQEVQEIERLRRLDQLRLACIKLGLVGQGSIDGQYGMLLDKKHKTAMCENAKVMNVNYSIKIFNQYIMNCIEIGVFKEHLIYTIIYKRQGT